MTHICMKRFFNIAAHINLLICLLLCSCTKTTEENNATETGSADSYINITFGTRSTLPSVEEDKEAGVKSLRVIIFDDVVGLESNNLFTATNAGRVPSPIVKVMSGRNKTIYLIANETGKSTTTGLLKDALSGVKTESHIEQIIVDMEYASYSSFNGELLMFGKKNVDAETRYSMLSPQLVSCELERLTSKITLNARCEAGMTVKIKKITAKSLHTREFLYPVFENDNYKYPTGDGVSSKEFIIETAKQNIPQATGDFYPEFDRYYLGTNYDLTRSVSLDIQYEQQVGTNPVETKTKVISLPDNTILERNVEYAFDLNFLSSQVTVNFSVKDWVDKDFETNVIPGTFLSLSESELTMYGKHQSTIYFETDGNSIEMDANTQSGEPVSKYFTTTTISSGASGDIVLTPKTAGMSSEADGETKIGLYFTTGNIRKQVKITHVNRDAYVVEFNANGGTFNDGERVKTGNPVDIDSDYSIPAYTVTNNGLTFSGWALSETALKADFTTTASYDDLGRPKDKVTLYAVWTTPGKVSLMFSANGMEATGMPPMQTVNANTTVTIPNQKPTATDYTFEGWDTKSEGTGTRYPANNLPTTFKLSESVVLYAIWIRKPVTVNLLTGWDGKVFRTYTSSPTVQSFIISGDDPTRAGHRFGGWCVTTAGRGDFYEKNTSYKFPEKNMDIYAVWHALYKIHFNLDDGNGTQLRSIENLGGGQKVVINDRYYFEEVNPAIRVMPPHYRKDPSPQYDVNVSRYLVHWRDASGNIYEKGKSFEMPNSDLNLTAVYQEVGTFDLWLHVGGTRFSHLIKTFPKYPRFMGAYTFTPSFSFGYWGRFHRIYYPKGEKFLLNIYSSWDWPPHYNMRIHYSNGKYLTVKYASVPSNQITVTEIYPYYIDPITHEIFPETTINNIEIIN